MKKKKSILGISFVGRGNSNKRKLEEEATNRRPIKGNNTEKKNKSGIAINPILVRFSSYGST